MFCPNCGTRAGDGAKFCTSCGQKMPQLEPAASVPAAAAAPAAVGFVPPAPAAAAAPTPAPAPAAMPVATPAPTVVPTASGAAAAPAMAPVVEAPPVAAAQPVAPQPELLPPVEQAAPAPVEAQAAATTDAAAEPSVAEVEEVVAYPILTESMPAVAMPAPAAPAPVPVAAAAMPASPAPAAPEPAPAAPIAGTPIPVAPAPAPVAPAPPVAPPVMQAAAPVAPIPIAVAPKKSGSGLKITLILVGIFVFLAIVVGGGIFGLKRMQAKSETADQHIARLVREAAGLQKPPSSLFGEDKIDTRMRDMFRQMFKLNKDYQDAVNQLDVSQMSRLSTAESFADPDSARGALQQLHAAYDLDAQQEQNLQQLMDNFRNSLNDLPAAQRVAFVTAFNRGLESVMPLRRRATTAEKAWVDSVDDIYSFCDQHHSQMQLIDGHLQISDPVTLEEFNTKVRTLNYRREQFQRARADFDRVQQQQYQKMGAGPTGSTTPDSSGSKF